MIPRAPITRSIVVPFAADLARHGARAALVTTDEVISYGLLADRVEAARGWLGDDRSLVLVVGSHRVDMIVWYLASLTGSHPVLVMPEDDRHVEAMIERYDPDVVVRPGWDRPERRRPGRAHDLHADLALLLSTSGSTGSPKLVRLSAQNLQANAEAIASYLGLTPEDRAVTSLPMHYCYGLSVLHSHLAVGASVVLTDLSVVDDCFWELFRHHSVTGLAGVPHTFDLLDRVGFDSLELPSLRYVTQAGGRLAPDKVRRLANLGGREGWDLFVMYGQTEATARMAYLPPDLAADHPGSIGIPVDGGEFRIEPGTDGGDGELIYRGPNVMLGYSSSVADLARGRDIDELRTGDLARMNDAGLFEITGRANRFVKLFGLRIDLAGTEVILERAGLSAICARIEGNLDSTERLGVLVEEPRAGDGSSSGASDSGDAVGRVIDLLRAELGLPASAVAAAAVECIPRLPNGKPDHSAIAALLTERADAATTIPASATDTGRTDVAGLFGQLLDADQVTGTDTFVSLGGDSLAYVEVSVALENLLGHLPDNWHVTPVRELESAGARRRRLHGVETTLLIRAVAIVAIVGSHAHLFRFAGGAHILLAVAGFNFARFQVPARRRWPAIARIALPSMAWIGVASLTTGLWGASHTVLVHSFVGDRDSRFSFWFVETLIYLLVAATVLLRGRGISGIARRFPLAFALGLSGLGLAIRHDIIDLPAQHHHWYRPQEVLWIFAAGWAAAHARTIPHRMMVTAVVWVGITGFFGDPHRELTVFVATALFVWVPAIPVPRMAQRVAALLAGSSLYIYLLHWQVLAVLDGYPPVVYVAVSLPAGVAAWKLTEFVRASAWPRLSGLPESLSARRRVRPARYAMARNTPTEPPTYAAP